ncbi:hypothetical protein [Staphylococcus capitis]|uniref:Uncharacterized protein n=1 Tax=Staphylococcus capitis TaxID=29388 RepID=A0ABX1SSG6_STACP|nr:hypothetical protein [Staphylococcus capitis]NMK54014.1 hypothetical protein [Staphylococcus capitis]NMK69294.1 hypothetical protein [Staphylococcus capitis]
MELSSVIKRYESYIRRNKDTIIELNLEVNFYEMGELLKEIESKDVYRYRLMAKSILEDYNQMLSRYKSMLPDIKPIEKPVNDIVTNVIVSKLLDDIEDRVEMLNDLNINANTKDKIKQIVDI